MRGRCRGAREPVFAGLHDQGLGLVRRLARDIGKLVDGQIGHYQITMKVGFRLDED